MFKNALLAWVMLCASLFGNETPTEFQLTHDQHSRIFHVHQNDVPLNTIVNSSEGVFDFYDSEGKILCTNIENTLYDTNGNNIGKAIPRQKKSITQIDFEQGKTLISMQIVQGAVAFSDAVTNKLIAVGFREDLLAEKGYVFDTYVDNWKLAVVDTSQLKKHKISYIHLLWTLMKHIQTTLPNNKPFAKL